MSKTISLYPSLSLKEDLTPDFGTTIDQVCKEIHDACKGWGTDEKRLINAIGNTTPEDRVKISLRFHQIYGKDLRSLMKSECSGDLGQALQFLALSPPAAECAMIQKACDGVGTDELLLYPIICGRSDEDMELLKKTFYKFLTKDLGKTIDSDVGGDFEKVLFACLQAVEEEFDPNYHTMSKAKEDAERLWKAGQGKWFGTDEDSMFKMIVSANPKYLKMVNEIYADKHGYTLMKAFEKELGGNAENAALFHLGMKLKPYETVAGLIKKACAGIGTNELLLTSCIIRYQSILPQVNLAYKDLYGKSIHDIVRSELGGDFEKLLVTLINKVDPEH